MRFGNLGIPVVIKKLSSSYDDDDDDDDADADDSDTVSDNDSDGEHVVTAAAEELRS